MKVTKHTREWLEELLSRMYSGEEPLDENDVLEKLGINPETSEIIIISN